MRYTTILLLIIASSALGNILPGQGIPDAVMFEGDAYSTNLAHAFDLSHARFPIKSETTLGRIYGDNIPFQSKDFAAYGVEKLTSTKWIGHNIAAFVYDHHKVIIQVIDGNGKLLLKSLYHDFNILQDLNCTGFEYNSARNLVYVGCFGANKGQQGPGKLLIATYDLHLEEVTSEITLDQKDGFEIRNNLELRIVHAPQESNEETYMIAYDQGHGNHQESRSNHMFRVFRNVDYRKLTFYYLGEIGDDHHRDHAIMYDMFPYRGSIIITGRLHDTKSIITIAQCKLSNSDRRLYCGSTKPTLVTEGFVGIYNEGVMVTADIPTRDVRVYQLSGQFTDSDWNTKMIHEVKHVDMFDTDDTWISSAEYSPSGGSLSWAVDGFGKEHGTTLINWRLNYADSLINKYGFVWNKSFIYGDEETGHVFLLRNILAEVFVAPFDLKEGENDIKVTMSDKENKRDASAKIFLMTDLHEEVSWNTIEDSDIASGASGMLPINGDSIKSGNSLTITAKSNNADLEIVDAFFAKHVNVSWDAIKDPAGNFFFAGSSSVIESQSSGAKQLTFSNCEQAGPGADVSCKVLHNIPLSNGDVMGSKILELSNGGIVAYTTNDRTESTTFIIVSGEQVHQHTKDGMVTDVAAYPMATSSLDYVAVSTNEYVEILEVNPHDITEWNLVSVLTSEHFDVTDFCPSELRVQTYDKWGWFIILSNCHNGKNYSQQIFTWAVTKDTPTPTLPLSSLDNPRNICAFMKEIIVATNDRVYGISILDDWNYWSIPLNHLGVGHNDFDLECIESQNTAVITGHAEGTQQKGLIQIRGNSGYRQDRRYPHTVKSISADVIYTYDFLGSTFHTGLENGTHVFVQSYLDPVVLVKAKTVTADTKVEVEVTITNENKSANTTTHVTVKKSAEKKVLTAQ